MISRNTFSTFALSLPPFGLCLLAGCTLLNTRSDLIGGNAGDDDGGTSSVDGGKTSHDGAAGGDSQSAQDGKAPVDSAITDEDANDIDSSNPGGAVTLFANRIVPGGLTVQGGDVCWVEGQTPRGIYCGPTGGGSVRELDITSDMSFLTDAFDVALDDTYVYWSNGGGNQIIRRARSGGSAGEYFSGGGRISYITIEGTILFATDYLESGSPFNEVIYGPGVAGVSSNTAYTNETSASGVAHSDATVYFGTDKALNFGPEHGNVVPTSIPTSAAVGGVAIDAQKTVYFTVGNRSIFRLIHGSTTPQQFYDAGAQFGTSDIAVDDGFVYWSERDNGKIMKMAKLPLP